MLSLVSKDGRVWGYAFLYFFNQYCKKCYATRLLLVRFEEFLTYIYLLMIELRKKLE